MFSATHISYSRSWLHTLDSSHLMIPTGFQQRGHQQQPKKEQRLERGNSQDIRKEDFFKRLKISMYRLCLGGEMMEIFFPLGFLAFPKLLL